MVVYLLPPSLPPKCIRHPMEDSMDMDMSPLRPQNCLFGCELKANKDYHFKVDNDENEHQLSLRTHLVAVEEDAESADEEEEDVKLLSMSRKRSAPGGGSRVPQKKVKLAAAADFDDEETEEKVPVKKSICSTPAKNAQKSNQNGKDSKPSTPRSKGQESFKKQEKTPKTPKGPSPVEDIKAKMQASIEKGGSLPRVEAKFINYVQNCFRMTDQEAIQDLWQWRKSL
ncbi:hypothetical protein P7K49_030555 [Saguinus oedipus]|uniref:Nucleophosmin C-terminal domain-containing protein n=1 Tax=Saguinus oedipus TaxID=9490 RepID=A0ABQ9U2N2_SAGOE|nr:hypothetical protein P7K49_030555 [Saguinus oedipus]